MSTVVVNGIFVGLVYGLLAVGLVVVYRVSRIVNFAYGETGMLAAFVYVELRNGTSEASYGAIGGGGQGAAVSLALALLLGGALGAALEIGIARPLRNGSRLNALVGTIATSLLFVTFAVRRWGGDIRASRPLVKGEGVRVLDITISPSQLLIGACTVAIVSGLAALYRFTSVGIRLRATASDPYAASLIGLNTGATSLATWTGAGALAALSAILIAPLAAMNVFFMTVLAMRSFAAALVGGLTSLWGGFAAGVLLGVTEGVIAFKSPITGVTNLLVAVGILVLMVARPGGLVRADY